MAKIIGNTTAAPNPRPDWLQTDETRADYIKNKQVVIDAIAEALEAAKLYTDEELAAFDFIKVVDQLPESGLSNKIYLVPKDDAETRDLFDEYIWANGAWEWITTKEIEIDLTPYVEKESGKGLSTNDYTTEEKMKVAKIPNVTLADAGKFLRVDANGNIITETIMIAEEASV